MIKIALQIQDITMWLIFLAIFNYAIIFRKNRFFGSIGYLLLGLLMFGTRVEFGYTETIYGYIALFIFMGGLLVMIYEIVAKFGGSTKSFSNFFTGEKKR